MNRFLSGILYAGLALASRAADRETLTQYSTLPALLAGLYDGEWTCAETLAQGDFGLGTFDRLNGEMVVLDGRVYRVASTGRAEPAPAAETTPFACVTWFDNDLTVSNLTADSLNALCAELDRHLPSRNLIYALRLDGEFAYVKTRSVPPQEQPYRPLAEIAKTQPTFEWRAVRGTLVGFRCPAFMREVNVAGWHLHFISADRAFGGHVLDVALTGQTAVLDATPSSRVTLSSQPAYLRLDLAADSAEAVKAVEK